MEGPPSTPTRENRAAFDRVAESRQRSIRGVNHLTNILVGRP